ncbi:hypothetical protein EOM39_07505, partial [Candidatus Gracilibacteria bacterium]|nr:hypothetical protein [Candidatus Gracilibacteria bacterium]
MYNFKPNTKESDKIVITDFKTGVVHNGSSIGKNKNSLASCVNFDFTIDGKIKRRKSFTLKFNDDGNTAKIYGMGIWNGTPIRYKNSYVQAEYSGVWTNIGSSLTSASSGLKKQRFIGMDCVETDSNLTTVTLTTGGDYKFVKTSTSMPANAYVGNYIYIQGVYRLIIANTTDTIYIDGNLGVLATSGTCTIHKTIKGLIFNTSSRLYYIDPKGTFINPTTTTITETRSNLGEANIEIYANRLFHTATSVSGSDINRIYFSELGVGNSFYGNNYINIPCKETIIGLRAFKDRLVIYTYKGNIYYLYGDTPDNFRLEVAVKLKGCISAESICEGHNMQFYASEEGIELLNMIDNGGVNETIPLSDIIKDEFFEYDLEDALGVVCNSKAYFIMPSK